MNDGHGTPGEFDDTDSYGLTRAATEDSVPDSIRSRTEKLSPTQWKPSSRTVDESLVEGLSNEDLWMLIRRFNKVGKRSRF